MSKAAEVPLQRVKARPLVTLLIALGRVAPGLEPAVQRSLVKAWYQIVNTRIRDRDVTLLNYGYVSPQLPPLTTDLEDGDDPHRNGLELYRQVIGRIDLRGADVLEVGCGRGGGAAFIMRQFQARTVIGIDIADKAISFCQDKYRMLGLSFRRGGAENMPFPSRSFDVLVNVESSHCYPSMERFLREVTRVVRPMGHFLFADFRPSNLIGELRHELEHSGLVILEEQNITDGVLRSMDLDTEWKLALIAQSAPSLLRNASREFSGIRGSRIYQSFRNGEMQYLRFILANAG